MADMALGSLVKAILAMVVLAVLATVFATVINPVIFSQQVIPELVTVPLSIVYDNIPCMINCLTSLEGDELTILSQNAFNDIDDSPVLLEWFPCNNDIMTIGMMINELVRFEKSGSDLVRDVNYEGSFYDEAVNQLITCIESPLDDEKCYDSLFSFNNFCREDDYLVNFNFLPCSSSLSFVERLSPSYLRYSDRRGLDIDNDFRCDSSIGDDYYNPPYSLCSVDPESKFNENCRPAWALMAEQEVDEQGLRETADGRCEDFIMLYYSLFRSIDVSPDDLSMNLGVCDLPCPCKELMNRLDCSHVVSQDECFVPATLTVSDFLCDSDFDGSFDDVCSETISGCSPDVNGLPDPDELDGGRFALTINDGDNTYQWIITQNFTQGDTWPVYRTLTLDADYDDDVFVGPNGYSSDPIIFSSCMDGSSDEFMSADGVIRLLCSLPSDFELVSNLSYQLGLKINIIDLDGCEGDNVVFGLGFSNNDDMITINGFDDNLTYYSLDEGEVRGVEHRGFFHNDLPLVFAFYDESSSCKVKWSYDSESLGLIIRDVCRDFYGQRSFDELLLECSDYVSQGLMIDSEGRVSDADYSLINTLCRPQ